MGFPTASNSLDHDRRARLIIGGLPRSGTTLLRHMIDQVGQLTTFPETSFFLQPLWHLQSVIPKRPAAMAAAFGVPVEVLLAELARGGGQIETFDRLVCIAESRAGVSRRGWVEKSPRNCEFYERLARQHGGLAFVSLVRHGLDVVTSRMPGHPERSAEYWCPIQRYIDSMEAIMAFRHPRHVVLRYEDFVANPRETVCRLHELVDLPLSEQDVPEWAPLDRSDPDATLEPNLSRDITRARVGRWRGDEYAPRVAEFLSNREACRWLVRAGYELP